MINGVECTDHTLISKTIYKYYSDLYSSNFSPIECNNFFDKIIPHIDNDWRDCCDYELHIEELDSAVQNIKLNKSPGPDGLTANFYKFL